MFPTADLLTAMNADWRSAESARKILRVDGGVAASDWTMQRLADLIDAPVDRPRIKETTTLGAASGRLACRVLPEPARFAGLSRSERRFTPVLTPDAAPTNSRGRRPPSAACWRDGAYRYPVLPFHSRSVPGRLPGDTAVIENVDAVGVGQGERHVLLGEKERSERSPRDRSIALESCPRITARARASTRREWQLRLRRQGAPSVDVRCSPPDSVPSAWSRVARGWGTGRTPSQLPLPFSVARDHRQSRYSRTLVAERFACLRTIHHRRRGPDAPLR